VNKADILVVLPTLGDRLDTLAETLESIELQRKDVDFTLALVSPEDAIKARKMAQKYKAILIDDPKVGISEAINAGLRARTTESFYAWMGDDDLFRPGGLKLLKELIESKPSNVVSYGACEYIDSDGRVLATSKAGKLAQFLLPWGPDLIPHPGAMIKLDALEAIGGFDKSLKYVMDLDAFLKLQKLGHFISTKKVVSAFRWHPDSLTVSNRSRSSAEAEMVKRRHLPRFLRPIAALWEVPIRWASSRAAIAVNKRGRTFS
jgi:GT2 family glycosyltransferase